MPADCPPLLTWIDSELICRANSDAEALTTPMVEAAKMGGSALALSQVDCI